MDRVGKSHLTYGCKFAALIQVVALLTCVNAARTRRQHRAAGTMLVHQLRSTLLQSSSINFAQSRSHCPICVTNSPMTSNLWEQSIKSLLPLPDFFLSLSHCFLPHQLVRKCHALLIISLLKEVPLDLSLSGPKDTVLIYYSAIFLNSSFYKFSMFSAVPSFLGHKIFLP